MNYYVKKWQELDSTNLEAIRAAKKGEPEGTLIQTERQLNGRGRRGRTWESPAGSNLYMTLLLRPELTIEQSAGVTLVMALACQEGILRATGLGCEIKWPNDLVLHKRKVVGILTEAVLLEKSCAMADQEVQRMKPYALACGVGINVNQRVFPEELADKATSLFLERAFVDTQTAGEDKTAFCAAMQDSDLTVEDGDFMCDRIRDEVLAAFSRRYEQFLSTGDLSLMKEDYEKHLINKNRPVRVLDPKGTFEGIATGIDNMGQLLVKTKENGLVSVYAGEVSVRGLYEYV